MEWGSQGILLGIINYFSYCTGRLRLLWRGLLIFNNQFSFVTSDTI